MRGAMRQLLGERLHLAFGAVAAANQPPRLAHQALEVSDELPQRLVVLRCICIDIRMDRARLLQCPGLVLKQVGHVAHRCICRRNPRHLVYPWCETGRSVNSIAWKSAFSSSPNSKIVSSSSSRNQFINTRLPDCAAWSSASNMLNSIFV